MKTSKKCTEFICYIMARWYEVMFGKVLYGGVLSGSVWHGINHFMNRPATNTNNS